MGMVSPPLRHVFDQFLTPDTRVLIPGAGRAYEAIYLHRAGHPNVWVCDWADEAFAHLRRQVPDFPVDRLLVTDFFELTGTWDLVVEQTFLSALLPAQRPAYVRQVHRLLSDNGHLTGVLFNAPFPHDGPPFGATPEEYAELFEPAFHLEQWHTATDSIAPRRGRELFVRLRKKTPTNFI